MSRPQFLKRLVTAAVLLSLCSAPFISHDSQARAAKSLPKPAFSTSKISPDLRQLILSGKGDTRVKVIVQSSSTASTGLIDGLLKVVGGLVVDVLSNLNMRIVDITANEVETLAADSNVSFVSLDTSVRAAGHLTNTTGTQ